MRNTQNGFARQQKKSISLVAVLVDLCVLNEVGHSSIWTERFVK